MQIQFEVQKNKKWLNILQYLLDENYFKHFHWAIRMKLFEVNKSNKKMVLLKLFSNKIFKLKIKFNVGTGVKVYKKSCSNKNNTNWIWKICIVIKVLHTNSITYKIKDLNLIIDNLYKSIYGLNHIIICSRRLTRSSLHELSITVLVFIKIFLDFNLYIADL